MITYHQIRNFLNFYILQVVKFWKFADFLYWTILENWLFYEIVDNENLMLLKIVKFGKFLDFFSMSKIKIWVQKLAHFGILRPFDIPHYSSFRQFSYLLFEVGHKI